MELVGCLCVGGAGWYGVGGWMGDKEVWVELAGKRKGWKLNAKRNGVELEGRRIGTGVEPVLWVEM